MFLLIDNLVLDSTSLRPVCREQVRIREEQGGFSSEEHCLTFKGMWTLRVSTAGREAMNLKKQLILFIFVCLNFNYGLSPLLSGRMLT